MSAAGAAVAHMQPAPALGADDQARQQGGPRARHPDLLGPRLIRLETGQIPRVLRPGDVSRATILEQHVPPVGVDDAPAGTRPPRLLRARIDLATAVGVGPGVDRVLQQVLQRHPVRPPPFQVPFARPFAHPDTELDAVLGQIAQHRVARAELRELAEDEAHDLLHLLVRVQCDFPRGAPDVAAGDRHGQIAAAGLAQPPLFHPLLEDRQLGLAHRALEPEQEAVVVLARVVDAIDVGDERAEEGADLQELVPILRGTRQPGHVDAEHEADVVEADLRDEALEADAPRGARAGPAEVVVDDDDTLRRPAQILRAGHQPILEARRLLMVEDLLDRGLPDVDDGEAVVMAGRDLLRARTPGRRVSGARRVHRAPPRRGGRPLPGVGAPAVG